MSGAFDPYHKWLGIPPREQPANHYRLLGLDLFEADGEVVERAADRQMSYVEGLRNGEQHEHATKLLEQLAAARQCLLDEEKKQLYNEGLRDGQHVEWKRKQARTTSNPSPPEPKELDASQSVGKPANPKLVVRQESKPAADPIGKRSTSPIKPNAKRATKPLRKSRKMMVLASGMGLSLLVVLVLITFRKDATNDGVPNEVAVNVTPGSESAEDHKFDDYEAAEPQERAADPTDSQSPAVATLEASPVELPVVETQVATSDVLPSANDNAVDEFPYDGLILWLDAADAERVDLTDDGRLQIWYDGSEAEHNAIQADTAAQPKLVRVNADLSVAQFGGSQSMSVEDAAAFNLEDEYSIIIVARGAAGVMLDKGDGYNDGAFSFWNGVTSVRTHRRTLKANQVDPGRLQIHTLIADDSQVAWHVDGKLDREIPGPHTIDNQEPLLVGRRAKENDPRHFVGEIGELLIYNRALSDSERTWVEEYLTEKWLAAIDDATIAMKEKAPPGPEPRTTSGESAAANDDWLPAPRGAILREVWLDVVGSSVEDFASHVTDNPTADERGEIDRLEPPEDFGDNYGQRLRGYLHPPMTGEYELSVRANAGGLIYLSTDEKRDNKRLIEPGAKVTLQADAAYFLEVFHKESTGRDYLSVSWMLPDGSSESPIPGERLSIEHRIAPAHQTRFVPIKVASAKASAGSALSAEDDGRIVVTSPSKQPEQYELVVTPSIKRLTAVRVEALPHSDLPGDGPGVGVAGRFAVSEIALSLQAEARASTTKVIEVASVVGDDGRDLKRLIDGKEATVWRGDGRGQPRSAIFVLKEPFLTSSGKLLITIANREGLGCFRVSGTSADEPRKLDGQAVASATTGFALHVNLGGETYTAPDGVVWQASKMFDNETFGHEGGRSVKEEDVQNPVQGSALRGIQAFRAVVPEGTYDVTLYFCEYWSSNSTARLFSIGVEQRIAVRNMDLLKAAGGFAAPMTYPLRNIAVKDGRLDVEFQPSRAGSSAILNAIRIRQTK